MNLEELKQYEQLLFSMRMSLTNLLQLPESSFQELRNLAQSSPELVFEPIMTFASVHKTGETITSPPEMVIDETCFCFRHDHWKHVVINLDTHLTKLQK